MAFQPNDKAMLEGYIQVARPLEEMFSVKGKVALVPGGSSGLLPHPVNAVTAIAATNITLINFFIISSSFIIYNEKYIFNVSTQ